MEKVRLDDKRVILIYIIFLTAWFLRGIFFQLGYDAVFHFPKFQAKGENTSQSFRYPEGFAGTLRHYTQFQDLYKAEASSPLPGLEYTNLGNTYSTTMVPQGICIAGDYMLISAYDYQQKVNSVIYVLENSCGEKRDLLVTLILPDKNHVGGITFDGKRLWIAKSVTKYCSILSYDFIQEAVKSKEEIVSVSGYEQNIYCVVTASFISYYNEKLWIGTYRNKYTKKGELSSFTIQETTEGIKLDLEAQLDLPTCAQGVSFLEQNGKTFFVVTASYNRYSASNVYVYELKQNGHQLKKKKIKKYQFPPMAEEVLCDGEYTYMLFESAATAYSTEMYKKCRYPIDRICGLSTEKLFLLENELKR